MKVPALRAFLSLFIAAPRFMRASSARRHGDTEAPLSSHAEYAIGCVQICFSFLTYVAPVAQAARDVGHASVSPCLRGEFDFIPRHPAGRLRTPLPGGDPST